MALVIPNISTEYVRAKIVVEKAGVVVDPTSDAVYMAFPLNGVSPTTWYIGAWETSTDSLNRTSYYAKVLIGPAGGAVTLAIGRYGVWVKISDSPETPIIDAGRLTISDPTTD